MYIYKVFILKCIIVGGFKFIIVLEFCFFFIFYKIKYEVNEKKMNIM